MERPFWLAFRQIADEEGLAINALAAKIDEDRGIDSGLATAIRLYVLKWYQDQAAATKSDGSPPLT